MKSKLLTAALTAVMAFSANQVWADTQYSKDYADVPEGNITHASRYTSAVSLYGTVSGDHALETLQNTTGTPLYTDATDQIWEVEAGETLTATISYVGQWMHKYVYVDWGADGKFDVDLINDGPFEFGANNDLVAFNFFSPSDAGSGYNSINEVASNSDYSNPPSFVVPTNLKSGDYRIRFKVDWNNVDPAGCSDANNLIANNGGIICDVTLRVKGAAVSFPAEGQAYILTELATGQKLNLTEGYNGTKGNKPNQITTRSEATPVYFISAGNDQWYITDAADGTGVFIGSNTWNAVNNTNQVAWTIDATEDGSYTFYQDTESYTGYLGCDAPQAGEDFNRVYVNKESGNNIFWGVEVYEEGNEPEPEPTWDGTIVITPSEETLLTGIEDLSTVKFTFPGAQKLENDVIAVYTYDPETLDIYTICSPYYKTYYPDDSWGTYEIEGNSLICHLVDDNQTYGNPYKSGDIHVYLNGYLTVDGVDISMEEDFGYSVEVVAPVFAPVEGQAYNIMYTETEGIDCVNVTSGSDKCETLVTATATPSTVFFTKVGEGWTIQAGDKYLSAYTKSNGSLGWSTGLSDEPYVWTVEGENDAFILVREDGKNIKVENGKLYCDNTDASKTATFHLQEVVTYWNGEINVTMKDALTCEVEFEEASKVDVTNYGVLGGIYDESGDIVALAVADADEAFNMAGSVEIVGRKATVHFETMEALHNKGVDAKALAKKIGGFTTTGEATVYICGKSFKADGEMLEDAIILDYDYATGNTTGINAIEAADAAKIFDLQGRRVVAPAHGLFIQNGQKVIK